MHTTGKLHSEYLLDIQVPIGNPAVRWRCLHLIYDRRNMSFGGGLYVRCGRLYFQRIVMIKEYKLTIQAAGRDEQEATEAAIRMLNLGASFDEATHLLDVPESLQVPEDSGSNPRV